MILFIIASGRLESSMLTGSASDRLKIQDCSSGLSFLPKLSLSSSPFHWKWSVSRFSDTQRLILVVQITWWDIHINTWGVRHRISAKGHITHFKISVWDLGQDLMSRTRAQFIDGFLFGAHGRQRKPRQCSVPAQTDVVGGSNACLSATMSLRSSKVSRFDSS